MLNDAIKKEAVTKLAEQHIKFFLEDEGHYNWTFKFTNKKRSFGTCHYINMEISLSWELIHGETMEAIEQTILHEIAHALTPGHRHDIIWKAKALSIGVVNPSSRRESTASKEDQPAPSWVMVFEGEIVANYYKRPRRSLARTYIPGRKAATLGKLRYMEYGAYLASQVELMQFA